MPEILRPAAPRWQEVLLISLFALCFYSFLFGVDTLHPAHTVWLLQGDPAQHYLGWQFFRAEPWQWPPGRIANWGYPLGAAIGLSDSIPLLAFAFKPFEVLLPAEFQYFGWWMSACFVLNGYWGLRLLSRYTNHSALRVIGAIFFVISPPLLLRGYGHEALMAQWLLLAGMELYLRGWSASRWLTLALLAAWCHPYLLLMVLGLLAAAVLAAWRVDHSATLGTLARHCTGIAVAVLLALWLAGYFSGGGSLAAEGYGYFSMNVLSLIDPLLGWSRLLPQWPIHPDYQALGNFGQYEGFLYLGAGMLALLPVAVWTAWRHSALAPWLQRPLWPLALVAGTFWILALSNVVTLADQRLFTVPLPSALQQALSVFRASGRLGWPAFYLISLFTLVVLVRGLPERAALLLLGGALLLQGFDQSHKYEEFRSMIRQRAQWQTPLLSPQWNAWAAQAHTLVLLPPEPMQDNAYIPLAHLAARHGLRTNVAHIARSAAAPVAWRQQVLAELQAGHTQPGWIYVWSAQAVPALPVALQSRLVMLDRHHVLPPAP